MPTFPTYHGELPKRLNPRRLRHYFLLAYWVYFRPTALKCYLYQADPELYRAGPGLGIFRTWRIPAYRNLYLMTPGAVALLVALLSVLVGLPIVLVTSWMQGTQVEWSNWVFGVALGLAASVVNVAAAGLYYMVAGILFGVSFSVSSGVADSVSSSVATGLAVVVGFSVAIGLAFGLTTIVAFSVAIGLALGLAFGLTFTATRLMIGLAFGLTIVVVVGLAFGVAGGVEFGVVGGVEAGLGSIIAIGVPFAVAGGVGALRAVFYPFQVIPALRSAFRGGRHPLEWDELIILPLPGTQRALARRLQQNETAGLRFLAQAARNPFQRWAAQAALQFYLHEQSSSLQLLYTLLASPSLSEYVFAPASKEDWEKLPSVRQVLLGELDKRWVDCSSNPSNRISERLVWALTRPGRDHRKTPLTRFAGMLYELLDERNQVFVKNLVSYAEIYTGLNDYPGGEEIARTFEAMAAFLSYDDLSDLPRNQVFSEKPGFSPIRPTVLTALSRLGEVGAEVAAYQDSTSRVNQLAALARATDDLDDLDEYIATQVMAPEQYILRRIIQQWRRLVSEAGGEVGRAEEIGPVANPYVAGPPVVGDLFVGREDILRRLEELWGGEGQRPSVVIYGHRRMGKSSILHNLGARFGTQTVVVDFNMQRAGLVASTGELLYNLALALYDAGEETRVFGKNLVSFEEPHEQQFTAHNSYTAFDRFLKHLGRVRARRRFIVTVDEFELIEKGIQEGQLEPRLLDFWRGLIQTYPWFVMAFAGLHTLQEMTRDYWHPLFGSVTPIPVSFLGHAAVWRLITQPTPDFSLDYDREAVERIITLTHSQPYLAQLIGHGLVTRFNRQTFEEGKEQERRFSLADVEAVVNAPEFYRDGDAYFTGVWRQAESSNPPGQTTVLRALAQSEAGMPVGEIAHRVELTPEETRRALETLAQHDVVMEIEERWQFTVELMRRWVRNQIRNQGFRKKPGF